MVLLYKSKHTGVTGNQLDFDNAAKEMSIKQQSWLKNALSVMFSDGHNWLNNL